MRRLISLLLFCTVTLAGLPACNSQAGLTDLSAAEIGDRIAETQPEGFAEPLVPLTASDHAEEFRTYVTAAYGLEDGSWADGVLAYHSGVGAAEIAVLQMKDAGGAEAAAEALAQYAQDRAGDFFGYAPEEYALLEEALVLRRGLHVALVVCPDPAAAAGAFDGCFSSGTPADGRPAVQREEGSALDGRGYVVFDPPNQYDMTPYDGAAIVEAHHTGDRSALSKEEDELLVRCEEALAACVTGDMTSYEKELAVHDWMAKWADYDHSHAPESLSPLTFLRDKKGICLGYANTFQLLMDLLDIECVTVIGAAFGSTEDHAWNMVRLDGDWYCVDVTWDDTGGSVSHGFFNVTSSYMRQTNHQWDYDTVPEAEGLAYAYRG